MKLNQQRMTAILETAYLKAAGNDRCLRAISRASVMLDERVWDFDVETGVLQIAGGDGRMHTATASGCNCPAVGLCKHRVGARLLALYHSKDFAPIVHLHRCECGLVWSCAEACEKGISAACPTCDRAEYRCAECGRDTTADGECIAHPNARQIRLTAAEMIERRLADENLAAKRAERFLRERERRNAPYIKPQHKGVTIDGWSL